MQARRNYPEPGITEPEPDAPDNLTKRDGMDRPSPVAAAGAIAHDCGGKLKEVTMPNPAVIGLDIAKNVFQVGPAARADPRRAARPGARVCARRLCR